MVKNIALLIFILFNLLTQVNSAHATANNSSTSFVTTDISEPSLSQVHDDSVQGIAELSLFILSGAVALAAAALLLSFALGKNVFFLIDSLILLCSFCLTVSVFNFNEVWQNIPAAQVQVIACLLILVSSFSSLKNQDLFFYNARLKLTFRLLAALSVLVILSSLFVNADTGVTLLVALFTFALISHSASAYTQWKHDIAQRKIIELFLILLLLSSALALGVIGNFINLPFSEVSLLQISLLMYLSFIVFKAVKTHHEQTNDFSELDDDGDDKDLQLSGQMLELQFALKELQEKNEQLEKLNTLDELSGIHNRRHFDKRLQAELRRCRRELTPLSLIMCDIDHFKKFNDTYGHIAGDEVIRTVALTSSQQLNRDSDEIFRYGGEEYAIILPNTDLEGAMFIAEKVRAAVANTQINSSENTLHCTISLGVCCHLSEQAIQPIDFIERADKALYQSKQNGRNQVAHYNQ